MMNKIILTWICMFCLLASMVFAATGARIITDPLAPGCSISERCHVLEVTADSGESVIYTVKDVEPETTYTVSFMYKLTSPGMFRFGIDDMGIESGDLNNQNWRMVSTTLTTSDDVPEQQLILRFTAVEGDAKFLIDELQMTPSPEPTKFNNFKHETGCCPFDFCWTGGTGTREFRDRFPSCIHDDFYEKNVSMPPIGWDLADFGGDPNNPVTFIDAPNGYRCINGTWKFARAKFTPLFDKVGYCPDDDQCYNGDESGLAEKACTDSGDTIMYPAEQGELESFYCYRGNWTTRTKEIALQLLNMANKSTSNSYTIFCDRFDRSLNPDETSTYYRDYVGDRVDIILTSGIVNEFCIMELNGQVIAGVSLNNIEINEALGEDEGEGCVFGDFSCMAEGTCGENFCLDNPDLEFLIPPKSFIEMLKGSDNVDYCDVAVENKDGLYNPCQNNDVYYNAKLQSVIFTKPTAPIQDIPFEEEETFIQVIFKYLRGIISDLLGFAGVARPATELVQEEQLDFIKKAGSFDKLYISYSPEGPNGNPRSIKAIREIRANIHRRHDIPEVEYKTFISAEYRNYPAPICRFFYRHNYQDVRAQISDNDNIQCTPVILDEDEWMYSIYVEEPVFELDETHKGLWPVRIWKTASDNFWNDITAKIRTQAPSGISGKAPPTPEFTIEPDNPVVGTRVKFSISSPKEEEDRWIARTWEFGDGSRSSSAYNITPKHNYSETGNYTITLWVMNQDYRISRAEQPIDIRAGPVVDISEQPQTAWQLANRAVTVVFTVVGGNLPCSISVDWGDGEIEDVPNSEENIFTLSHSYSEEEFEGLDTIRRELKVSGHDRDGVMFDDSKEIIINKGEEVVLEEEPTIPRPFP